MHFSKTSIFSLLIAGAVAFAPAASANDTPALLKGAVVVDAAKAKSLMDAGAKMIDTRGGNEYAEAHVKGAISVPYKEKSAKSMDFDKSVDSFDLSKLPSDKTAAIITLCNGAECWKSYKSATAAIKAGYQHVYWLRGGIPEWKAKGFPIE